MTCAYEQELAKAFEIPGFKELYLEVKKRAPMIKMLEQLNQTEQLKKAVNEVYPTAQKMKKLLEKHPEINPSLIDLSS
jgi:DNA phosphorothioation-dependent restriction protein DptG